MFFCFSQGALDYSRDIEKQIHKTITPIRDELEREDEEPSSTTEPTIKENAEISGRDTDEDASFSENEQIPSQSFVSDEHKQTTEESHLSSSIPTTDEKKVDHEIFPTTTTTTITEPSINKIDESESKLQATNSTVTPPEANIYQNVTNSKSFRFNILILFFSFLSRTN